MTSPLLDIRDLRLTYATDRGEMQALRGVNLQAMPGEVVGIVGESGCGKSSLALASMALLSSNARLTGGEVRIQGKDIYKLNAGERRALRGRNVGMIFQDPMTAFNPVLTIGHQLVDFQYNLKLSAPECLSRAAAMLTRVGLPNPESILARYVHELSGGMRQRVGIAAALLMKPAVLIADEPTTALDVTMEAQIIHLLRELRRDHKGTIVVVTHHLGVIGELCDRVYVMYAGQVVEEASVDDIYHRPRHPYTKALIDCDPAHLEGPVQILPTIPGRLPDLVDPPKGCAFAARCPQAKPRCSVVTPPRVTLSGSHSVLCSEVSE
jgi:oligopeptide/dipeptide ABC transporter ATP-binding protein